MNLLLAFLFAATAPWRQQQPQPQLRTPNDSTIRVVQDVGQAVAGVRSDLDHLRMLLVTDSLATGSHAQAASALGRSCDRLAQVATQGRRIMCLHCLAATVQPAFNGYRDYLPSVAAMSRRCVARLRRTQVATASPSVKRQMTMDLSTIIVTGLRPYERHVSEVLTAMRAPARRPPPATARPSRGP